MTESRADEALESLLRPSSVAVIGATEDFRTYAGAPIHNLAAHGYRGAVYPVNPRRETVQGLRAFASVLDIPGPVETAVIAVPSAAVIDVLRQAIEKGVKSATVVSSGFGEEAAGPEGKARHAELEQLIRSSGIRVLGPNTTGLSNLADSYVPRAAFNQLDPADVRDGQVALITQSGACGNIVFNRAQAHGVGVGLSVATGDQIDIDVWDIALRVLDDARFTVVLVVAETMGDVSRLERAAMRAAEAGKVIAVLKLGRSEAGRRAVMTHSGSLAGDSVVLSAAMRHLGIVEVDELDDLWRLALMLQHWGVGAETGGRLGVMSLSGGEAAIIADRCAEHQIDLPACSPQFGEYIKSNFAYAMASNPFDPSGEITGRPEKLRLAIRGFVELNGFTEVLFATPVLRDEQAKRQLAEIGAFQEPPHPNVCYSYWPAGSLTAEQARILHATGAPAFEGSSAAVRAIALYRRASARRRHIEVARAEAAGRGSLSPSAVYADVRAALAAEGIEFAPARVVRSPAEARAAADELGYPVVLKANVTSSVHKQANRLVDLDVRAPDDVEPAYARLAEAGERFEARGVVVEARGRGQLEVIVGATRDPIFGPTVVFGSGGSTVEYLHDAAVAVARYLDASEAEATVRATRVGGFVAERSPAAVEAVASVLVAVARWFIANGQVESLDLNPLLVDLGTGRLVCVDARVA